MSKSFMSYFLAFSFGAAAGSVVAWRLLKDKYEQIAQEEIDSVKAEYSSRHKTEDENELPMDTLEDKPVNPTDLKQFAKIIQSNEYVDYSNVDETTEQPKEVKAVISDDKPYVITPEEFGEFEDDGYECVSLTYYADGVLTDEYDEPVNDIENKVGEDFSEHFGEYENDSVFIRNDRLRKDFEILADVRNYSDVSSSGLS